MIGKVLLWVWQLPQNVVGWIFSLLAEDSRLFYLNDGDYKIEV